MKLICGNDEDWLSPATIVGEDDDASYVLFIAWSQNLPMASLIADETGLDLHNVIRCINLLVECRFIRDEAGFIRITNSGDLFLRALGFQKDEMNSLAFNDGWSIGNVNVHEYAEPFSFESLMWEEETDSGSDPELRMAA